MLTSTTIINSDTKFNLTHKNMFLFKTKRRRSPLSKGGKKKETANKSTNLLITSLIKSWGRLVIFALSLDGEHLLFRYQCPLQNVHLGPWEFLLSDDTNLLHVPQSCSGWMQAGIWEAKKKKRIKFTESLVLKEQKPDICEMEAQRLPFCSIKFSQYTKYSLGTTIHSSSSLN